MYYTNGQKSRECEFDDAGEWRCRYWSPSGEPISEFDWINAFHDDEQGEFRGADAYQWTTEPPSTGNK